jgi:hypothetical protein
MPRPTAAPGLSTTDLALIRNTLAAGRKPKVVFTASAGQIAGQVGQVVALTDATTSDEWIVVRVGRDELPFAPADLQPVTRALGATKAAGADKPAGATRAAAVTRAPSATRLPTSRTATPPGPCRRPHRFRPLRQDLGRPHQRLCSQRPGSHGRAGPYG